MADETYQIVSQMATQQFDARKFYDQNWRKFHMKAVGDLRHRGRIVSPEDLRRHPDFANFFDGRSYTPVVFMRMADIMPSNPMGRLNPDVAIFMHEVRIAQITRVYWWLDLKCIIRGPTSTDTGRPGSTHQVVWEQDAHRDGAFWLNELAEVYKWPIFGDLERLGYNPDTIEREISVYEQEKDANTYSRLDGSQLADLVRSSRFYVSQLDVPDGEKLFNRYTLMLAPVDDQDPPEPWFQAPLFKKFNPRKLDIQLEKYMFDGLAIPGLDRMRYKAATDLLGRSVLIPEAIVRPTSVVPSLHFETVFTIPLKWRSLGLVLLDHFPAVSLRVAPDPEIVRKPGDLVSNFPLFGSPRPIGHPFEDDNFRKLLYRPHTRQIAPPSQEAKAGKKRARTPLAKVDKMDEDDAKPIGRNAAFSSSAPRQGRASEALSGGSQHPNLDRPPLIPQHYAPPVRIEVDHTPAQLVGKDAAQLRRADSYGQVSKVPWPIHPEYMPPSQPQSPAQARPYEEYKPGEPNPYQAPQENALDALQAHLRPELEDMWRYL